MIKEIIKKKQNKVELSSTEISFVVNEFLNNNISNKVMTEFLKSIYKDMSIEETFALTISMLNSGQILNFKNKKRIHADKHSTGGISDSTTLIIAPIIACAGINFLKMSGSKLGFTGGTVEKLYSFKGYNPEISLAHAEKLLKKNGSVLMSFSDEIVPADKRIYQLRDKENIIMSIPLIASSVMSKKLADDSDVIILDVKCGNGAFMKTEKDALNLAKYMISIGKMANKKIAAVVSDMNQPLGFSVGSLLETIDALNVLKNTDTNSRLRKLSVYLSAKIIELSKNIDFNESLKIADNILKSGKALSKFKKMIKSQKGSLELFSEKKVKKLLGSPIILRSEQTGYLNKFNLEKIGYLVREYCSNNNHGIKFLVELGDYVKKDMPVIELYGKNTKIDFLSCLHYSKTKKNATNLIIDVL